MRSSFQQVAGSSVASRGAGQGPFAPGVAAPPLPPVESTTARGGRLLPPAARAGACIARVGRAAPGVVRLPLSGPVNNCAVPRGARQGSCQKLSAHATHQLPGGVGHLQVYPRLACRPGSASR